MKEEKGEDDESEMQEVELVVKEEVWGGDNSIEIKRRDEELRQGMKTWDIHAKKHPRPIDLKALVALAGKPGSTTVSDFELASIFLHEDSIYEQHGVPRVVMVGHRVHGIPVCSYYARFIHIHPYIFILVILSFTPFEHIDFL